LTVLLLSTLQEALKGPKPGGHIYIAYSGGLDSQVLLHITMAYARIAGCELTALHMNYGLSPNANVWQDFCERQCEALGIPLLCKAVDLNESATGNIEQRARNARYIWFESQLDENDVLLMAHNQEDQAETLLLRMMRASGTRGLAGIPVSRALGKGRVLRPFLDVPRSDLRAYAEQQDLTWVEDESNFSSKFDRNYIRNDIIPKLLQRWPQASRLLSRSAQNYRDDQLLLDELAVIDAESIQVKGNSLYLEVLPPLDLARFKAISPARQRNLLQYLLRPIIDYPVPAEQMNECLRQVNDVAQSQLELDSVTLVLHDGQVHFTHPIKQEPGISLNWITGSPLPLPRLNFDLDLIQRSVAPTGEVKTLAFEPGETVCVHWRLGGERVHLQGEEFSRSLKKLFQEKRVAPWLRRAMPLISVDGYIVWSAMLGDFSPCLVDSGGLYYSFELSKASPKINPIVNEFQGCF
jgi:tRNA(Ile)-lysidine synthase